MNPKPSSMQAIIGRKEEQIILNQLLESKRPEFLAVYGRRRVGKTFLIRQAYASRIVFQMTGIARANTSQQLTNFFSALRNMNKNTDQDTLPKNWFEAFEMLKSCFGKSSEPKKVIFFDEMPWIDTPRSNFLSALEHFWNSWASDRPDIILVVCGSAASWCTDPLNGWTN
ncbi:MAG TPA: ATP-binding protein [Puia sp.]|jgi:hypothetical protein|nr:ATP-binding protein [Puia sp.]